MQNDPADFESFEQVMTGEGVPAALQFLRERFLQEANYHQLFEVLKMEARRESGLPLLYEDHIDTLEDSSQKQFEDKLLAACETVGELFFKAGDAATGWMYFQPIADSDRARQLLMAIDVNEDNVDDIVQVALVEGVAPQYGFELVLKNFGTCNSITTYDSQVSIQPKEIKRDTAAALVAHLYRELMENVRSHIQDQEGKTPEQESLRELIENRDWLFSGGGHHVDTTHLASVVRIARQLREPQAIQQAIELAEYGMQLDEQFHFEGDEPFEQIYPDHLRLFRGLVGIETESVEAWFLQKISKLEPGMIRSLSVESLIDFLHNTGQNSRAIKVSLKEINDDHQAMGIAPNLFAMAQEPEDFVQIADHFRTDGNLLSYSIARMLDEEQQKTA